MIKNLEVGVLEFEMVGEFLEVIKKEFGERDSKSRKVAELKQIEQENRIMEEFVQEFRRVARGSGYKERPLMEKFKRGMNRGI